MIEISRGTASEYDEIIDFIDFVFSKANRPHDFPTMYPNLYRRTDESMSHMVNLRENGALRASILCYPRVLNIGGEKLKVYGIGSVATYPHAQGRGFMSTLMKHAVEEMRKEGVHLSNLGGRRSRYNHFGYEISGNSYGADLPLDALYSAKIDIDPDKYAFKALTYDDRAEVEACKAIYDEKPVHYDYDYDDFYLRMYRINGTTPYAVYENGKIIGYLSMNVPEPSRDVKEICLIDDAKTCDVLFSFMIQNNTGLKFRTYESQLPYLRPFFDISGEVVRSGNGMWNVLRYKDVIRALAKRKTEYAALEPGRLVFDVEGEGKFAVSIGEDGSVSVADTDGNADFTFKGLSATRAFFGPSPEVIFGIGNERKINTLIRSWFPLPLTWLSTESV